MLLPTSRIEKEDLGIKFYEQDMLVDDYVYTGDLDITVSIEYSTPGFGIALINSEGYSLKDKNEILLLRIGFKEASIIYRNGDSQKTIAVFNCPNVKTYSENLIMNLKKQSNNYVLTVDNKIVGKFKVPYEMLSYNIGYYSSPDNTIKNINIASSTPYGWIVNMSNTKYGYINFEKNGFSLTNCKGIAELEQIKIKLLPGTYYLKYEKEEINELNDITAIVKQYDDNNLFDEEKNMLSYIDGSFKVNFPTYVNLKFQGTSGRIKKIQITTQKDNDYISTSPDKGDVIDIDGSRIEIKLDELEEVKWDGEIFNVVGYDHTSPIEYAIISDGVNNYGIDDLKISKNRSYTYHFETKTKTLTIKDKERIVFSKELIDVKYLLTVFKNISAVITSLKLKTKEGTNIDSIIQNTVKKYVPATINSPIVVTDKNDIPFNLSASFRKFINKHNKEEYVFTNYEREYFNPKHIIKLTNTPANIEGTTIVYGIKKDSQINMDKILNIPNQDNINSIDSFAVLYDILFEKDLRSYDKDNGEIRLYDVNDYKMIVVDYLKRDSYAINYKHDLGSYEVDISVDDDKEANIIYDNTEKKITATGKYFINSKDYVVTKIKPTENCYIVIGR